MTFKNYFILLWLACIVSAFAIIPFTRTVETLLGNKPIELTPIFFFFLSIEAIILYGLAAFFGLKMARKLNITFFLLDQNFSFKNDILKPGFIFGSLCAATMLIVDWLLPLSSLSLNFLAKNTPPFYGLIAALFGVINQEVLLCLLVISGFALLLKKIFKQIDQSIIMWISIILTSLLFGIAHLPTYLHEISWMQAPLIARCIILNCISGITFGLLFWRKGFETAVFAHITVDFILYFMVPSFYILVHQI